ncbi:MAG: sulfotransferase [Proteobacteria bacterium]|nr:sulfotransferase [Pseudomonadota bacterium]
MEKTPGNTLNVEFVRTVFPDARFIFLHRYSKENINSIIEEG